MNEILGKLSNYNIFNFLFPGAIFSFLADRMEIFSQPDDFAERLIWYYFVGMAISRIGSLLVEPVLRWLSFVRSGEYEKYLQAAEADSKLELMIEVSNTYRTIATTFIVLLFFDFYVGLMSSFGLSPQWQLRIAIALLGLLFLAALSKQSSFVSKRIKRYSERT